MIYIELYWYICFCLVAWLHVYLSEIQENSCNLTNPPNKASEITVLGFSRIQVCWAILGRFKTPSNGNQALRFHHWVFLAPKTCWPMCFWGWPVGQKNCSLKFFVSPFLVFLLVRFGFKMVHSFNTFGNLYSLHIVSLNQALLAIIRKPFIARRHKESVNPTKKLCMKLQSWVGGWIFEATTTRQLSTCKQKVPAQ